MSDVLYLCNGKNTKCKDSLFCYKNGGDCMRTAFEYYALNGPSENPENDILRFEKFEYGDGQTFYYERDSLGKEN